MPSSYPAFAKNANDGGRRASRASATSEGSSVPGPFHTIDSTDASDTDQTSRSRPATHGTASTWRWASHVRACVVEDQIVLLDLVRGRYLGLAGKPKGLLLAALAGRAEPGSDLHPLLLNALQALLRQGLLVRDSNGGASTGARTMTGCDSESIALPSASHSLDPDDGSPSQRVGALDLARFLRAITVARLSLKWRSLHSITLRIAARRQKLADREAHATRSDLHEVQSVVTTFEKLRPLIFTARDHCLFDSLALVELLASHGHHPQWVLGVRTYPFRAHAWVQLGDLVLNDHHEHVRRFQPILVA